MAQRVKKITAYGIDMKFNYQARTKDGQIKTGVVEARDKESAMAVLRKNDLYVNFIEKEKSSVYSKEISFLTRISEKDVVIFSRQMAIMFKSGISIVDSLESVIKQTEKKKMQDQISKVLENVKNGKPLSAALTEFPKTFDTFYVGMIKAGEATGKLPESLDYLAESVEKRYEMNRKVIGSLIYPGFIMCTFGGVLFFMMTFVVPGLGEIFGDEDLPLITEIVLNSSAFVGQWWWVIILSVILLIGGLIKLIRSEEGSKVADKVFLKTPVLSNFIKKLNLVKIAENLSTLIEGGLPIIRALDITSEILGSHTYRKIIQETKEGVEKGELISSNLENYPDYFPMLFVQMALVGEKTGKIQYALKNVVNFYQRDTDRALEGLIKILEPAMIIALGGVVGVMVIAILLPIYQMSA